MKWINRFAPALTLLVTLTMLFGFASKRTSGSIANMDSVKIGTQVWTVTNLDVTTFRNGDEIVQAKSAEEWTKFANSQTPAWCYYNFDESNGETYGKLYNGKVIKDARGIAPKGWHVPSNEEWETLRHFLDASSEGNSGKLAGAKMKATNGLWREVFNLPAEEEPNNSSGFSALPGGNCNRSGSSYELGITGKWWSTSFNIDSQNYFWQINDGGGLYRYHHGSHGYGFSIRCIKD